MYEQYQHLVFPAIVGCIVLWILYNRGYIASTGNSHEPTLDRNVMVYRQLKRLSHTLNEKDAATEVINHVRKYKPNPDEIRLKVDNEPQIRS
jgi:hypothetical protein